MAETKRRGRPPGSKNKAKAEAATAAPGHNSEDQRKVLFFHHLKRARDIATEMAELKKEFDFALKEAEEDGIPKGDLRWALKAEKQNQERALAKARREMEMARWLNLPIGTQLDIFAVDRTPVADRAFEDGKTAGLQGKTCISPYDPSTEQSQKWIEGWHAGQAVHRETFLQRNGAQLIPPEPAPMPEDSFDDAVAESAASDPLPQEMDDDIPAFLRRDGDGPAAAE
jgi:ribosome modulation factor